MTAERARSVPAEPLVITIELSRRDDVADAHVDLDRRQIYRRRRVDGSHLESSLGWGSALQQLLAGCRAGDVEARARVGRLLRDFLDGFDWRAVEDAIQEALGDRRLVVLNLVSDAAELWRLPWPCTEFRPTRRPLGACPGVVIRLACAGTATRPPAASAERPGRIVVAWSGRARPVPWSAHVAAVSAAGAGVGFRPPSDVLADASLETLAQRLRHDAPAGGIAALHLLCHGAGVGETFGLMLSGPDGPVAVEPGRVADVLGPFADRVRLVVIAACDGGNPGGPGSTVGSVAAALHQVGFEAVIGADAPIEGAASVTFAEAFYGTLLGGPSSVEQAFDAARRRVIEAHPDAAAGYALQLWARAAGGHDTRPIAFRPYRGLLPFEAEHAPLFFGRVEATREAESKLAALVDDRRPRMLVISAASGIGKSSLARARLLPALGRRWPGAATRVIRPGSTPLATLNRALSAAGSGPDPVGRIVLVDQFEEVFTRAESSEAQAFSRALWTMSCSEDAPTAVILTLRVDFVGRCGELAVHDGLTLDGVCYDERHAVFVGRMSPDALRSVIEGPAARVGLTLEPGLAARMIDETRAARVGLPLLEHALDRLWLRREGRVMTHRAYDALGGVSGALSGHADRVVGQMSEAVRAAARRLLVELIESAPVGREGEGGSRRRMAIAAIAPVEPTLRARFDAALGRLVDARLLTSDDGPYGPTVEIAHEALIGGWARLRGWFEADREALADVRELTALARSHRRDGTLLQGNQLGRAATVVDAHPARIPSDVRALVERSVRARRRRIGGAIGMALIVVLITSGLAAYALREARRATRTADDLAASRAEALAAQAAAGKDAADARAARAQAERSEAEARRSEERANAGRRRARDASLIALATEWASTRPERAVAALRELTGPTDVPVVRQLYSDLGRQAIPRVSFAHDDDAPRAEFSPDGRWFVSSRVGEGVVVGQADGRGKRVTVSTGYASGEWAISRRGDTLWIDGGNEHLIHRFGADDSHYVPCNWSLGAVAPSSDWLVCDDYGTDEDGEVTVQRAFAKRIPRGPAAGSQRGRLVFPGMWEMGHVVPGRLLGFAPDDRLAYYDEATSTVGIRRPEADSPRVSLPARGGLDWNGPQVAFDGQVRHAAVLDGRRLRLWALSSPDVPLWQTTLPAELVGDWHSPPRLTFVAGDTRLVVSTDEHVRIVSWGDGPRATVSIERLRWSKHGRISADGRWALVPRGGLDIWPLDGDFERPARRLPATHVVDGGFAVDPEDRRLVGPCPAGLCVWAMDPGERADDARHAPLWTLRAARSDERFVSATFSPDGRDILAVSNQRVVVVDAAGPPDASRVDVPVAVRDFALGPTGRLVLLDAGGGLWAGTSEEVARLETRLERSAVDGLIGLSVLPDGRIVVADRTRIRVLAADSGRVLHALAPDGKVCSVSVADDGGRLAFGVRADRNFGDARIAYWDIPSGAEPALESTAVGESWLCEVALSADGQRLARAYHALLRVCDVGAPPEETECDVVYGLHAGEAASYEWAAFTPDGPTLFAAISPYGVFWGPSGETHDLRELSALRSATAFTAAANARVVAIRDGAVIHVFDLDAPQESLRIPYPGTTIALTRDGRRLLALGLDGVVRIFRIGDEHINAVRATSTECLSRRERMARLGDSPAEACSGLSACAAAFGRPAPDCAEDDRPSD